MSIPWHMKFSNEFRNNYSIWGARHHFTPNSLLASILLRTGWMEAPKPTLSPGAGNPRYTPLTVVHPFCKIGKMGGKLWTLYILGTMAHDPLARGASRGEIAPLKPTKVTLFTMILRNSEKSIRDIRPFCRPLFCHSSVVKYASSLLP